jgi:hypothetical protein
MGIYHYIFLTFTLLASAAALYFYYVRTPNPRFRPRFGEMVLLTLLAIGASCGISFPVASLCDDPELEMGTISENPEKVEADRARREAFEERQKQVKESKAK